MVKRNRARGVFNHDVEGRADHVIGYSQASRDALDELRLPRAQIAREHHDIALMEIRRERLAELLGRLGGSGFPHV